MQDTTLDLLKMPLLERIGEYGFLNSTLKELSSNVKQIGKFAFKRSKLKVVDLPLLEFVDVEVFNNCFQLISVSVPLVKEIKNGAFRNCGCL